MTGPYTSGQCRVNKQGKRSCGIEKKKWVTSTVEAVTAVTVIAATVIVATVIAVIVATVPTVVNVIYVTVAIVVKTVNVWDSTVAVETDQAAIVVNVTNVALTRVGEMSIIISRLIGGFVSSATPVTDVVIDADDENPRMCTL